VNGGDLGLIEKIGLATAAAALDAAIKTADVKCVAVEKVIGVGKVVSVTVNITGQVAAVSAAVEAGVEAASAVGTVIGSHVLPRPHEDVGKLVGLFGGAKAAKEEVKEEPVKEEPKAKTTKAKAKTEAEK
jgi:microcompartment protein CcmL/EutN